MSSTINGLQVRSRLGKYAWGVPHQFGPDGWTFDHLTERARIIATAWEEDGDEWLHASIGRDRMPDYADLTLLHQAVFPGYAYQVFAPPEDHVNIHPHVLHLWGRADGKPAMPEFGRFGTI